MEKSTVEKLNVEIHPVREEMGKAAAERCAGLIRKIAAEKGTVSMIFAAAPSQNDLLESLRNIPDIPWQAVTAFHMDEYIGLPAGAPQLFSSYLKEHLFNHVQCREVHYINAAAPDVDAETKRYSDLLRSFPVDIVCMGIGENGHIAFNDPPVADFSDPVLIKTVTLDEKSRVQQVHDGCFPNIDSVPKNALTLTIPALVSAQHLLCVVPTRLKAQAVNAMLTQDVSTDCPASVLRRHGSAYLYLDRESASLL